MDRILVIRYGGLGDIVLSMAAFRTIRAHHQADRITALTTGRFRDLLAASGYFDEVLVDDRLKPWRVAGWLGLMRRLRGRGFDRVYDLQRNERTAVLYRLLRFRRLIEWSGVIPGCSHYVRDDPDDYRHITERVAQQLAVAGIREMLPPDLEWLRGDAGRYALPARYALLVPGGAPHRPEKRAPAEGFAVLGGHLRTQGVTPVLIGTAAERAPIDAVMEACAGAIDLANHTSFGDIADLARGAVGAIGNDTGPMHLAAAIGCPSLVLFSSASDPRRVAPQGRRVEILETDDLGKLSGDRLIAAWDKLLDER